MAIQSLNQDELRAVLEQAWAHRKRDWLMILTAWAHGLRASEVVAIQRDDISDGFISVQRLKGSRHTVQPLYASPDTLFDEATFLIEYVRPLHGNQRAFPITAKHFWRLFRRYAEYAGIPEHKRHPHVLKHTMAMQLVSIVPINVVQQYLGHKSLNSTGAYLKVTDEQACEQVRKALKV